MKTDGKHLFDLQFACVFPSLHLPFALCTFLRERLSKGRFYCNREGYSIAGFFLVFWEFSTLFFSGSRFSFILSIQHLSVIFKEREDIWCCFQLIYFLISQISGIHSFFRYRHIERIRCVQKGFNCELLNSRTEGGEGEIFDKYTIVNWMKKTKKHNS